MFLHFCPTIPRFSKQISGRDAEQNITADTFAGYSLGGRRATVPFPDLGPWLYQWRSFYAQRDLDSAEDLGKISGRVHVVRVFSDLSNTERSNGKTDYRAISIFNATDMPITDLKVGISQPSVGTFSLWKPTANTDGSIDEVADELTAPTGASWTSPTVGSPSSLGAVNANSGIFLWLRRVVAAGASASAYDTAVLEFTADTSSGSLIQRLVIVYSVYNTAASLSLAADLDKETTECGMRGRDFTLTVKDSSGSTVDPAGNLVFAWVTQPAMVAPQFRLPHVIREGVRMTQLSRVSQGKYRFEFRPPVPGHYHILFDAGGQVQLQHTIEVSPLED
jgi:hypothetical protein